MHIEHLSPAAAQAAIPALSGLLHDVVKAGASVNFVQPFTQADAARWWQGAGLSDPRLSLLVAEGGAAGCVLLDRRTPPNQPHRAEICKLLVHPSQRRRGLGRALMQAAEALARAHGLTLLTLDTRTGDAGEPLYAGLGFITVGVIPGFCVDPDDPTRIDGTTIMYKPLT